VINLVIFATLDPLLHFSIISLVHTLGKNTLDGSTIILVQNNISIAILIEIFLKKFLTLKQKFQQVEN
jgi:hypothetical protein